MEIFIKSMVSVIVVGVNIFLCIKAVKAIDVHCQKKQQAEGSCQCDKEPMVKFYIIIEALVLILTFVLFMKFW